MKVALCVLYYFLFLMYEAVAIAMAIAAYAVNNKTALEDLQQIWGLEKYHLYYKAIGEVYLECGCKNEALASIQKALQLTSCVAEKQFIQVKLQSCMAGN
jgi:predicted RNA polymerase sigma factor